MLYLVISKLKDISTLSTDMIGVDNRTGDVVNLVPIVPDKMSLHHGHCRERNPQNAAASVRASEGDAANIMPSLQSKVVDPHHGQLSTPTSSLYQSKRIHSHRGQLDLYHQLLGQFLQINPEASGSKHRLNDRLVVDSRITSDSLEYESVTVSSVAILVGPEMARTGCILFRVSLHEFLLWELAKVELIDQIRAVSSEARDTLKETVPGLGLLHTWLGDDDGIGASVNHSSASSELKFLLFGFYLVELLVEDSRSGSDVFGRGSLRKIGILGMTVSYICRMESGFLWLNVVHNPVPQSSPRRDFLTSISLSKKDRSLSRISA
ncbi:hypothetical protein ACTXT7_011117 [Hymenolepis weldensis]